MRAAILATLALASACGSSAPEVAPTPAPAPASGVPPGAGRPSIVAAEQYYDIDGSSTGALRNQIDRLGPKDESGKSQDALTVWSIEWGFGTAQRGDSCVLRDVKVTLNVAVTLPRWKPPAMASRELLKTWQAYFKAVRLHEAGHRTIAERNAREVMAALTPLRGTSCDKLSDEAARTAERIVAVGGAGRHGDDGRKREELAEGGVINT